MGNADSQHFDAYRDQTRLKHLILEKYLWAYSTAHKGRHNRIVYIDAFAGPGRYIDGDSHADGSPIRAVKCLAADADLSRITTCYFIERNVEYFSLLQRAVEDLPESKQLRTKPEIFNATFSSFMESLQPVMADPSFRMAPTFLFIDPCGVDGVRMKDVAEVLRRDNCEVFVFFNYDGVNRIAGAAASTGSSGTLTDLLGSTMRMDALLGELASVSHPDLRERVILAAYQQALAEDTGARFFLPFRIEAEHRKSTSHYFLHATKHPLGFSIMKSVMWSAAAEHAGEGGLEMYQATEQSPSLFLRPDLEFQRQAVLKELAAGDRRVSLFAKDWVCRPDDLFSEKSYKDCILLLEHEGRVRVMSKDNRTAAGADKRPKRSGKSTLGNDYWLRLAK